MLDRDVNPQHFNLKKIRLALISHRCCASASDLTNFFLVGQLLVSKEAQGHRKACRKLWKPRNTWQEESPSTCSGTSERMETRGCKGHYLEPNFLLFRSPTSTCCSLLRFAASQPVLACSSELPQAPSGLVLNEHSGVCLTAKIVLAYTLASAQNRWQSYCSAYTGRCLETRNIQNLKRK